MVEDGNAYYQWIQGTSMAAPHAAGVAALIVAEYGRRDRIHGGLRLNPVRTERILLRTATDTPCPTPPVVDYLDEGRDASYTATCEGDADFNGFYGAGIVNALDRMEPCVLRLCPVDLEQWSAPAHLRGLPGWAR